MSRIEILPVPDRRGALGAIFESAVLHRMRSGAEGKSNRRYPARAIVLVLEVDGEAEYGDESGRVERLVPGSCILVDPGLGHRYGPRRGSTWTEMYISFKGGVFDALECSAYLMANPVRHLAPLAEWQERFRAVLPRPGGIDHPDACNGRLIALLTEIFPAGNRPPDETESWIAEAKQMLEREKSNVQEVTTALARSTGLSPETLRKQFRNRVGLPMKSWQMAGRISMARSLLARGNMTQKEIALLLGFSDPQHFSRSMKRATGSPPGKQGRDG